MILMNSLFRHSFSTSSRAFAILHCAGSLTTVCITSAAEPFSSNAPVSGSQELSVVKNKIRDTKETLAQAQAVYSDKIAAVDAALSTAKEQNTIKPSTETYYREVLARFQNPKITPTTLQSLPFPPQFDSSPEQEPINVAWTDLSDAAKALIRAMERNIASHIFAAQEELLKVVSTAQKVEDLHHFKELVEECSKFEIDVPQSLPTPAQGTTVSIRPAVPQGSSIGYLQAISININEVLQAYENKDVNKLLQALRNNSFRVNFPNAPSTLGNSRNDPARVLLERIMAPYQGLMKDAQIKVERTFIQKGTPEEIEKAIEEFEATKRNVKLLSDTENAPPNRPAVYQPNAYGVNLEVVYRNIIPLLKRPVDIDCPSLQTVSRPDFALGLEFEIFIRKTSREYGEAIYALQQQRSKRQAEENRVLEQNKQETEKKAILNEVNETIAHVCLELKKVRSPKDAQNLSEELAQINLNNRRNDYSPVYNEIQVLQTSLNQIASAWANPSNPELLSLYQLENIRTGKFGSELRAICDLANREIVAQQAKAPELLLPPYTEITLYESIEKLTNELSDKGEWKRVYTLLSRAPISREAYRPTPRAQAIHSYLTGLNYEQAEQWSEAIAAYQTVLQCIAEHIPTKEATARLKELNLKHPKGGSGSRSKGAIGDK